MKKLGVIGGLGPIATAYFYELIIRMTDAKRDQDHIDMIIYSKPSIPDRTEYILGKSNDSPLSYMIDIGKELKALRVEHIAIPCITAHFFHDTLAYGIGLPVIHAIRETARYLKETGVEQAGVMATEGTIYSKLFQKELTANGIIPIIPSEINQQLVTEIIYDNVKSNEPIEIEKFITVSDNLRRMGAETIILGCSELSVMKRDYDIGAGFIDAMEVLAKCSILISEGKLKSEFNHLIS